MRDGRPPHRQHHHRPAQLDALYAELARITTERDRIAEQRVHAMPVDQLHATIRRMGRADPAWLADTIRRMRRLEGHAG